MWQKIITQLLGSKAAKKRRAIRHVRRSGLTQLMVFLNGLILTMTAFLTLSVFISQMRTEDTKALTTQISQSVASNLDNVNTTMHALGRSVELLASARTQMSMSDFVRLVPQYDLFEHIVLYKRESKGWSKQTLYSAPGFSLPEGLKNLDPFLKGLDIKNALSLRTDFPAASLTPLRPGGDVYTRPVLVVHPLLSKGQVHAIVLGVARLGVGMEAAEALSNASVMRLVLRDTKTGTRLLQLDRRDKNTAVKKAFFPPHLTQTSWQSNLGNATFDVSADITENPRMVFISRVPFLLLLFGLTITMIGTLYVRSNYRQAIRLSAMNNALTSKNLELKNQVDESSRLYETMQRSEAEYRSVIDSVSDIIFECDASGNLLFVNATWEKVTGFKADGAIGADLFDMLHPADQDRERTAFTALVRDNGKGYRIVTRLQTAESKYRAIELAFSMVRTDNMRKTRVVGTITDVEERHRAERMLAEAEKKYRTIVENAAGGIYQVGHDGRILSANPALARILGYDDAQQLISSVRDTATLYVDQRDRVRYIRDMDNFGLIRNHEARITRRDGQEIWISENARAVKDDDGNLVYYEGSIEDITQRKKAELALKEAKLQSDLANRAKSEFLANMSHELRTPLNAIIGFSEIIQNEAMGPVGQRAYAEYAGDINDSGKRLLTIINDILDISRIEAGERQLNETLFSLHRTASTCISLLGAKAEAGRLSVVNNLHPDMPKVIGEELAFKQILMNLLSNAIKFTPPDGRITIDADYAGPGSDLRMSITDTGVGMDDKEIEKAREPFGQVESAFSRNNSGTGLGLTLVDALIKMHDGHYEVVSKKGVGTTLTLVVPAKRVAQPQQENLSDNVTRFPGKSA